MALSSVNIFNKDDNETESTQAQEVGSKENAEASQDDSSNKGKHGEGTCCGSCS